MVDHLDEAIPLLLSHKRNASPKIMPAMTFTSMKLTEILQFLCVRVSHLPTSGQGTLVKISRTLEIQEPLEVQLGFLETPGRVGHRAFGQ